MPYDIGRMTGRCSVEDRPLAPGEEFIAALLETPTGLVRRDYSLACWDDDAENIVGYWRGCMPAADGNETARPQPVSTEQILAWFDETIACVTADDDRLKRLLYVTALLLVRRKALKLHDVERGAEGECLVLKRPKSGPLIRVRDPGIADDRLVELERELNDAFSTGIGLHERRVTETPA